MAQEREVAYSTAQTYPAGGGQLVFDLLFLQRLRNKYKYGKLVSLQLKTKWVADTGSSGSRGPALYNAIQRVEFKDSAGQRTLCAANTLLCENELDIDGYRNPNNIAASQTNDTQYHYLDLHPVEVIDEAEEDDNGILLSDIGDTGSVVLTLRDLSTALFTNGATIKTATTFQLFAEVEEASVGKQYPRTVIMDYPVTTSPIVARYNVKGNLVHAYFSSGGGVEDAGTALAEQNWLEPDLQYGQGLPSSFLNMKRERAGRARVRDQAGVIATDDHFARGQCVLLWAANRGQKISQMPDLDTLGVQNDGTVPTTNGACIVIKSIVDRPASLVAQSLAPRGAAAPSMEQVRGLYEKAGRIPGGKGAKAVGKMARRLPITVK